jgi:putative N6-adenine-specific DNA methylase
LEALKFVGLKPSRKIKLFNGSLEARLVKYEMYEGSKRTKFNVHNEDSEDIKDAQNFKDSENFD